MADLETKEEARFDDLPAVEIRPSESASTSPQIMGQSGMLYRLYISHAMASWGDRMWAFVITLIYIDIWPQSYLLVAIYGLAVDATLVLVGAHVGAYVDNTKRIPAVRLGLFGQNSCICISAAAIIVILLRGATKQDLVYWILTVASMIFGTASEVFSLMGTLAVEKDWVLVIAGKDSATLARTNSVLRRIDLSCNILAPVCVGFLTAYVSIFAGTVAIAAWNLLTCFPEYFLLQRLYAGFPALHHKYIKPGVQNETFAQKTFKNFIILKTGWQLYWRQSVMRAGLALALLYCTVLSFGSVMTAFVYSRGVSAATLAGMRGGGAALGVAATFLFPTMERRFGLLISGSLSIVFQLLMLGMSVFAVAYYQGNGDCSDLVGDVLHSCLRERNYQIGFLVGGVIMSRVGLWLFDLSVSQQLQFWVEPSILSTVNGVQNSFQTIFDLLQYVASIVLSQTSQFVYLTYGSVGFVGAAALLYVTYAITTTPPIINHDDVVNPLSTNSDQEPLQIQIQQQQQQQQSETTPLLSS